MLFPDRIRQLRIEQGMKQQQLAHVMGVNVATYSRYEHGERRPSREQVTRLARVFKTDSDELVAMWLADAAYDAIATDKQASRAATLLHDMMRAADAANHRTQAPSDDHPALVGSMGPSMMPMFVEGDAAAVMRGIEDNSIDCIVTTPPYWRRRQHTTEGVTASTPQQFVEQLLAVTAQAWRVLKPQGSLWLNMGDATNQGTVMGLPWRTVLAMMDTQGWQLVNDVVWNKLTSSQQGSQDHLRKVHEYLFHLVKSSDYYYNDEEMRVTHALLVRNDDQVVGSGKRSSITGERYFKKIVETDALTPQEKADAKRELSRMLQRLNNGEISDLRLFLRENKDEKLEGTTHKAQCINQRGYYIQTLMPDTTIPGDVWSIQPQRSAMPHYTVAPDALYRAPIIATCPRDGIVLDPYCGTGTACRIAYELNRRSIGIDTNANLIKQARRSIEAKPLSLF